MFAGPAILCLLTSLISVEQFSEQPGTVDADEVHVTIRLDGDNARRYVELIKSPEISASFKKKKKTAACSSVGWRQSLTRVALESGIQR